MSIVRVGLSETKNFADGYDAIFGKKKEKAKKPESTKTAKAPKTAKVSKAAAGTKKKKAKK